MRPGAFGQPAIAWPCGKQHEKTRTAPRLPRSQKKPVLRRRFFFVRVWVGAHISRCGKFFCVVKNRAAKHKTGYCKMEKDVS
jgi:hypothetical protein